MAPELPAELFVVLACPACKGKLLSDDPGELRCLRCEIAYPVRDGTPDFLSPSSSASQKQAQSRVGFRPD